MLLVEAYIYDDEDKFFVLKDFLYQEGNALKGLRCIQLVKIKV